MSRIIIEEVNSEMNYSENCQDTKDNELSCSTETVLPDKNEEYNPFEHREVAHPTPTLGSFFHLLKSSLGSGFLAMPAAFKHAGILPGCIGTALVGIIATHCVHILVRTSRELCQEVKLPLLSYADTCEAAFQRGPTRLRPYATMMRYFVDIAMAGVCLGGTSVYVIFVASSLKDIFDYYSDTAFALEYYCLFLLMPLVLITQLRYLKFLVPFSIFANVCLLVTFGITCYYTMGAIPNEKRTLVANVAGWPMFLSTSIFAMEGINVVMPVENEMAHPEHFLGCPGVLNTTMIFVAALYGVVGLFGYLQYGEDALGSITLNLPQDQGLALSAKVLVAIAVFFTYCLQMYAPMGILWTAIRKNVSKKYENIAQISLRSFSVLFTVILAIAVPDLELLIGVVGAIFFSTLGLLIPVVVETVHRWNRDLGPFKVLLYKNVLLLLFYLIVLCAGCYSSIGAIIQRYS